MILNAQDGLGCGMGDLILASWLVPCMFYAEGQRAEVLKMFGRHISKDRTNALKLEGAYQADLGETGKHTPRIETWAQHFGLTYQRPKATIPDEAKEFGKCADGAYLLFPQANWTPRRWPANYWIDLAWKLQDRGHKVLVFVQNDDKQFRNVPRYLYGYSWINIAAAMLQAQMVVANDSAPAHLGGTLNVPTLALMGPTTKQVFAHCPSVRVMTSRMDCTGCNFGKPFRAACDQGCMSLYSLTVDEVLNAMLRR